MLRDTVGPAKRTVERTRWQGSDDGDGVDGDGVGDGSDCAGLLDGGGDGAVGCGRTIGDVEQPAPHLFLKVGADEVQEEVEGYAGGGEVFIELFDGLAEERGDFGLK